jgi:N-acetylneuraminic acid mutarotase
MRWRWIACGAVVLLAGCSHQPSVAHNAAGGPQQSPTSIQAAGGPQQSLTPVQAVGNWRLGSNSPVAVQYAGTAVSVGEIWVAGGLLGSQSATNKTEFYDPTDRTWHAGPPLPFSLNHVMMVPYQNTVWLIGGFTAQNGNVLANASARVLILDKAEGRWVYGPSLHHARAAGAAAVVGNDIVVVGGRTGTSGPSSSQPVTTTEIFNGTSWHDAAPIPVSCNHLAAASDGTYLYAVGGHQITDTSTIAVLQRFDPATGQWTQLPPMPTAASGLGAVIVGDELITVGGDNGLIVFSTVRAYNLTTKKWSTLPSLPQPRTGLGVVYYNNILYAVDGASQPGHVASTNTLQILRVPS